MKKLVVTGYFGEGNIGDDALLLGLLSGISPKDYSVTVMSGTPEYAHRMYGVGAVARRDRGAYSKAIQEADALVFAGGSIFQDVTSFKSVLYYADLVSIARKAGKKVVMLSQGVGPLKTFIGKSAAVKAFNASHAIAVRDPGSISTLRDLGVKVMPKLAADLAFLLPVPTLDGDAPAAYQVANMKTVGISARPFGKSNKAIVQLFCDLSRMLFDAKMMPVMLEMDSKEDGELIAEIDKAIGGKVPSIRKLQGPIQVQQRMMRMDALIAMRLHAGILASTVGIPPYMVSYDPKVTAFAQNMDLPPAPNIEGLTATRLFEGFMQMMKDRDRVVASLQRKFEQQRQLATVNLEVLAEALR